ncbi:glutaredoxin domain-containing protein [Clostridium sporogenes]
MIKVIGKENCNRCKIVKTILENKNKQFEYIQIESLDEIIQNNYIKLARESNMLNFPIVIVDNKVVDFTTIK